MFFNVGPYLSVWAEQKLLEPDQTKRTTLLWVISPLFLVTAGFCVAVRLYSRIAIRRWFGIDDLLIILALVFSAATSAGVVLGVRHYEWDHHVWDLKPEYYAPSLKLVYFLTIAWGMASSCVRLSVQVLFYRLAKSCQAPRSCFWALHATLVLNVGLVLLYIFNGIFPCNPIRNFWAWPTIEGAHCLNEALVIQAIAILNTFSEFVLATLPLLAIFKLGVEKSQRWTVFSLLSLGYLVGVTGCVRTYFVCTLFSGNLDVTWYAYPQYVCSEVEIDVAIICACVAPLRPLARRLFHRLRGIPTYQPKSLRSLGSKMSRTLTPNTDTQFTRDHEAMAEWQSSLLKVIDIEGISDDAYAYTVTISGPTHHKRSILQRLGFEKDVVEEPREDRNLEASKAGLEISTKTEVMLQKSYRPYKTFEHGNPRESDVDYIEMRSSPIAFRTAGTGESSEAEAFEIVQTFYDDRESDDSAEVFPQMPPVVARPVEVHAHRFSRISRNSVLRRFSSR